MKIENGKVKCARCRAEIESGHFQIERRPVHKMLKGVFETIEGKPVEHLTGLQFYCDICWPTVQMRQVEDKIDREVTRLRTQKHPFDQKDVLIGPHGGPIDDHMYS